MKRALTGVKPTGTPHLGNYFGAIKPGIELQDSYSSFYFVANYHALTQTFDPKQIIQDTYEVAATWLSLGLDPNKATFFRQSDVPEVTELSWMLSNVSSMGDLTRAHAYKAAKDAGREGELNVGTFAYPILMAADILLYDSDIVPVGKDQIQHLEMARAMARRFNHYYGEVLKEPQEKITESLATIPGTDGRKMSKSYNNGIEPLAPSKKLKQQIMSIVTDSKGLEDPKDPETCNIMALYRLFASKEEIQHISDRYRAGNFGYGHAKLELLGKIEAAFAPYRSEYEKIRKDTKYLEEVFTKGAQKARPVARQVIQRCRRACGIDTP